MRASNKFIYNTNRSNNSNPTPRVLKKSEEMVDFPLGGKLHPSTINHHQIMKNLKPNEIRFTVKESLEMLDDPSTGHQTRNYLNPSKKKDVSQSYPQPRVPTGINSKIIIF